VLKFNRESRLIIQTLAYCTIACKNEIKLTLKAIVDEQIKLIVDGGEKN
jgi:hypothetical protein